MTLKNTNYSHTVAMYVVIYIMYTYVLAVQSFKIAFPNTYSYICIPYSENCSRWLDGSPLQLECMTKAYCTGYFAGKVLKLPINPQKP